MAAVNADRPLVLTGNFNVNSRSIPNFQASSGSVAALTAKAVELLSQATNENPHPVAIVPMPADKRVVVAQLGEVKMRMFEEQLYDLRLQADRSTIRGSEQLADGFFNYDAVSKRLDYQIDKSKSGD
jgi:6-phosphogluconolactonase (cycloisomerase 2 family)